jgi:hypothetical protein
MKKIYVVAIVGITAFFPGQQLLAQDANRSNTEVNRADDDHDDDGSGKWGLLGLLGLVGLAGLKKKDDNRVVRTSTPRTDR